MTWWLLWASAAALSIPAMPMAGELALVALGYFLGAEASALEDDTPGNTLSEGVWRLPVPELRWALGMWLTAVVLLRAPAGTYIAGPLLGWLPLHFALPGFEKRLGGALRRMLRRILPFAVLVPWLTGCPDLTNPTDPRVADPCYSPTIVVDTLTMAVDTVTWEWTPGECG